MTVGSNPTIDRSKLSTKRHIFSDKDGVPLSTSVIISANTYDLKVLCCMIIVNRFLLMFQF